MNLLVINSGSSSLKYTAFEALDSGDPRMVVDGELEGVGDVGEIFAELAKKLTEQPDAVGYRVVHPGAKLKRHVRIDETVLRELEAAAAFAPLHDPMAVTIIREGMKRYPEVAHYACFDTMFHETMPEEATVYALPAELRERGVRRYGFHGLSCESIVRQFGREAPRRIVIAHLGSGCSVTAVVEGRSVDTSMGLTPTGGVVMGTRVGDLDPGVVVYLMRQESVDVVEKMLNHEAGIVALSGMANDVKAVREAARNGDERALLSLRVFTRSVTKAIGSFAWMLGGVEAIVFSGGIGEHDAATRSEVLGGLSGVGVEIDEKLNRVQGAGMHLISKPASQTKVFVVPAQEDLMIAIHLKQMMRQVRKEFFTYDSRTNDRGAQ